MQIDMRFHLVLFTVAVVMEIVSAVSALIGLLVILFGKFRCSMYVRKCFYIFLSEFAE